jgi:pimeloyl-ACP methyl ester carboxylesterase
VKLVLIPGWHEEPRWMEPFRRGRSGKDGFEQLGYECTIFPEGADHLHDRIARFARFIDALASPEPVAIFGYSAGGIIARGFVRQYPQRAAEIAAIVQVAAPNGGLVTEYVAGTLRAFGVPDHLIEDIDVASPFMTWLNGTSGHWIPIRQRGVKRWVLDRPPIVAPAQTRILHVVGTVPKYASESDGVVLVDSATLEGHVPSVYLDDPMANHLNLGAIFDPLAFLARGFRQNDRLWPQEVAIADRFFREEART